MKINLQKLNPLGKNKLKDQKRDQDGKFTAGSGGLSAIKKLNPKRSAPIVILVALVGGFLVFRSFAGTEVPKQYELNYQHSAYQCPDFNKDNIEKNKTEACVTASAEALTYRYYKSVFGRNPDPGGYKYWVQQLAGDRTKPSRVSQLLLASGEANFGNMSNEDYVAKLYQNILKRNGDPSGMTYWKGQLDTKKKTRQEALNNFAATAKVTPAQAAVLMGKPDNTAFVTQLYVSLFNRQPDSGGLTYWKGQLDNNKITRSNLLAQFAVDPAARKALSTDFANFVKTATKIEVVPTAERAQNARFSTAQTNTNGAKKQYDTISKLVDGGRKQRDSAKSVANKAKLSKSDLTTIANNEKAVRGDLTKTNSPYGKIKSFRDQNKKLADQATEVAKWALDLPDTKVKAEYSKTVVYTASTEGIRKDLNFLVTDIAGAYKSAETKYQNQCNSGTDYNGSAPGCGSAPAPVNHGGGGGGGVEPAGSCNGVKPSSGSSAIKGCQKVLGVGQDGNWGCGTEAAFRAEYPSSTHRKICADLGDGTGGIGCNGTPSDGKCYYDKSNPVCPSYSAGYRLYGDNEKCQSPNHQHRYDQTSTCNSPKVKKHFMYMDAFCYKVKNL